MNLTTYINARDAERDLHYCPCCKDRLDADDMDLADGWGHAAQMRETYGAACCNACTDDHYVTEDGVMVRQDAQVWQGFDGVYSSAEALAEARAEAEYEDADRAMYRSWL